ncbi:MAG: hypothetical protein M1819_003417 [Sarea resinae]|nr:MAG: hypothetical protein M1819_003417 [Sarea resinae]
MPPPSRPPVPTRTRRRKSAVRQVEQVGGPRSGPPDTHHLSITTRKHVYTWTSKGVARAFESKSNEILATKRLGDGNSMLAVADDQAVVLHDLQKGTDTTYNLKGLNGRICLLIYGNDINSLFFTTSLQNSVQSYSLRQEQLLDLSHSHPSPPTVLALSPTSHLLVSASDNPPNIFLQNLTLKTPPHVLHPGASSASVVQATFHPERANVFLLAFADGTLAAYDATRISDRKGSQRGSEHNVEVGCLKKLHAPEAANMHNVKLDGHETLDERKTKSQSILTAAFLPGHRSRAVSVGADGKCYLVDFAAGERNRGAVLKSWHAREPATSLAVLLSPEQAAKSRDKGQGVGRERKRPGIRRNESIPGKECLVAVGRVDGKAVLFDIAGNLLGEEIIDEVGSRILDLEWVEGAGETLHKGVSDGSMTASHTTEELEPDVSPAKTAFKPKPKRKSLGAVLAAGRQVTEEIIEIEENEGISEEVLPYEHAESKQEGTGGSDVDTGEKMDANANAVTGETDDTTEAVTRHIDWQDVVEPYTSNYMDLFSPVKAQPAPKLGPSDGQSPVAAAEPQSSSYDQDRPSSSRSTDTIPRRKTLASRRSTGHSPINPAKRQKDTNPAQPRPRTRTRQDPQPAKGLALFAPYMRRNVMRGTPPPSSGPSTNQRPEITRPKPRPGNDVGGADGVKGGSEDVGGVVGDREAATQGDIWLSSTSTSNEAKGKKEKGMNSGRETRSRKMVAFTPPPSSSSSPLPEEMDTSVIIHDEGDASFHPTHNSNSNATPHPRHPKASRHRHGSPETEHISCSEFPHQHQRDHEYEHEHDHCSCIQDLRSEIAVLRADMLELRRLVVGGRER